MTSIFLHQLWFFFFNIYLILYNDIVINFDLFAYDSSLIIVCLMVITHQIECMNSYIHVHVMYTILSYFRRHVYCWFTNYKNGFKLHFFLNKMYLETVPYPNSSLVTFSVHGLLWDLPAVFLL